MTEILGSLIFAAFTLPVGVLLLVVGVNGVFGYLWGGERDDPFRWPLVDAEVIGHAADPDQDTRRVWPDHGTYVGQVNVRVLVRLPGPGEPHGALVQPGDLRAVRVRRPAAPGFYALSDALDGLAEQEAALRWPVGRVLTVRADPLRRTNGRRLGGLLLTQAQLPGSARIKWLLVPAMLVFALVGLVLTVVGAGLLISAARGAWTVVFG